MNKKGNEKISYFSIKMVTNIKKIDISSNMFCVCVYEWEENPGMGDHHTSYVTYENIFLKFSQLIFEEKSKKNSCSQLKVVHCV